MSKKKKKTEEEIEIEKFVAALKEMGYKTPSEFAEMACTLCMLITDDLPKAQHIAQGFALHCGYVIDQTGHVEKIRLAAEAAAAAEDEKNKSKINIDMSHLLKAAKKNTDKKEKSK